MTKMTLTKIDRATAARKLHVGDKVKLTGTYEDGTFTIKSITAEGDSVSLEFSDREAGWYVGGPIDTYKVAPVTMRTSPITNTLLNHLKKAGSITQVEAQAMYRIRHLPSQIKALKFEGYDIESEWKSDPINKQRYVRYHLRTPVTA